MMRSALQTFCLTVSFLEISLGAPAWAKVNVTMEDSVEAYLGDPVDIPCHYSFGDEDKPPTIIIQWFVGARGDRLIGLMDGPALRTRIFYGDNTLQMVDEGTEYSDRVSVLEDAHGVMLTVQDAQLSDERHFFCQVNGMAAGNGEGKTHLRVFDPPEPPVIKGFLSGISVTSDLLSKVASCESRNGYPKPNITWYRDNVPLAPALGLVKILTLVIREYSGLFSVQSDLMYKVTKEDKDAFFSCEVSYYVPGAVRTAKSKGVNITVHYPTTVLKLWKESPQGLLREGDTVELRCQGDGNPPPPFAFYREQDPEVVLDSSDDVLVLSGVTRADSGVYQCRSLDLDPSSDVVGDVQLTIHYLDPAVVVPEDSEVMYRGESLTATCNALSSLDTSTVWLKNGSQVGTGHMLVLQDASYGTAGEYVCEVTVPSLPGLRTSGSVHIIVQGAPQVAHADREEELEEVTGKLVNLSCEAHGQPRPSIAWTITGSQSWHEVVSKKTDHVAHSVVSVKVTSDVMALCNATNDIGTEMKAFSIKATEPGPLVSLKHGRVRGAYTMTKGTDRRVQQYLGIPFARAPVGPLRLAAPQPPEPWEGERDGTHQPPMCIQDPAIMVQMSKMMSIEFTPPAVSEDCLYLNVYTPADTTTEGLPVLVWIHGGALVIGAALQFDGSPLAAYENIVVVIIQYRLGMLGYLSTGDKHGQGNWGFLDQVAALKWVQENIASFGGNPQSVTVAGNSAGGHSASLLTLSPLAKGLFHRAIFQSGVATLGNHTTNTPLMMEMVANLTECEFINTEQLIMCLREKTEEQLVEATKKMFQMKFYLAGVVDGVFLTDQAEELLKRKQFMKVPVLLGGTNHEFGWMLPRVLAPPGWEKGMDRETIMSMMTLFFPQGASGANQLVAEEYLKDARTPEDIRDGFTHMFGDMFMVMPAIKVAGYHRDAGAPVYMYEFQHRPEVYGLTRPAFVKSDHADEVGFMFGACFGSTHVKIIGTFTKEEEKLCRTMMSYWANFVRTGSPNGAGLLQWPLYGQNQDSFMELGLTQTVGQMLRKDKVHFMTVTLPQRMANMTSLPASVEN